MSRRVGTALENRLWRRVLKGFLVILLVLLWIWLYRGIYAYLGVIFTRQEFRTNQIVLLGTVLLIGLQIRREGLKFEWSWLPQLYPPALLLALGCSVLYVLSERYFDVNTLSATLFGLGTYGFLGLWLDSARWRQGLPAAFLLVGALPFGEHMQTFIGYPVRVLTADVVQGGLQAAGVHSVSVDTILVFENGLTQVDLPCSGVKSLWTGGLFLIAATWIERRRINLGWVTAAAIFVVLLLAANLARVAVLVVIGQVAGWMLLAEMLHVPLGVLGFGGACAAAVVLLRRLAPEFDERPAGSASLTRPAWLTPLLAASLLTLALLYSPRPEPTSAQAATGWEFPAGLSVEPWSFSPEELAWLSRDSGGVAERWRFRYESLSGSMLFVTSSDWRAQHRPERCFAVYGLEIENSMVFLAKPDLPVRLVWLGDGKDRVLYSAAYWFQSGEWATDDYAARIWADMAPEQQNWVLVTLIFDEPIDPGSPQAAELYQVLHQSMQQKLAGGTSDER